MGTQVRLHEIDGHAKEGDTAAVSRLLESYRPGLLRHARRFAGNVQDAEDAVQEALAIGFRSPERLDDSTACFVWLCGIVKLRCLRSRARKKHLSLERLVLMPAGGDLEQATTDDSMRIGLLAALAQLTNPQQRMVWMYYGESMPQAQIAVQLEVTTGAVKIGLSRARDCLRSLMCAAMGFVPNRMGVGARRDMTRTENAKKARRLTPRRNKVQPPHGDD